MKPKNFLSIALFFSLFLSLFASCPATSCASAQTKLSCCMGKKECHCPMQKKEKKNISCCNDQAKINPEPAVFLSKFSAFPLGQNIQPGQPIQESSQVSLRCLPDYLILSPPQTFDRRLPSRSPPV